MSLFLRSVPVVKKTNFGIQRVTNIILCMLQREFGGKRSYSVQKKINFKKYIQFVCHLQLVKFLEICGWCLGKAESRERRELSEDVIP